MQLQTSSLWRSLVHATPLERRSHPLQRRKDKTVTVTSTATETQTIHETYTVHITTELFSTIFSTITVPTTIHHTATLNVSVPTTTTVGASPPASIVSMYEALSLGRVGQEMMPISSTSHGGGNAPLKTNGVTRIPSTTQSPSTSNTPNAANATPTPSPVTFPSKEHKLGGTVILGIVLGSLAFVALIIAGLLFSRRMYKMYREQRVMRKQAMTEGNEMPTIAARSSTMRNDGFHPQAMKGGKSAEAGENVEVWEEIPPAYSSRV